MDLSGTTTAEGCISNHEAALMLQDGRVRGLLSVTADRFKSAPGMNGVVIRRPGSRLFLGQTRAGGVAAICNATKGVLVRQLVKRIGDRSRPPTLRSAWLG